MSIEKLKALFGGEEILLELVEVNEGEFVLRNGRAEESKELIKINIHQDIKELLEDQVQVIAQQMVQVILFNLLEKQIGELHTEIIDEPPTHFS